MFPKPLRREKVRKPMKRQGRKGLANQQKARARRVKARAEGWLICEIRPILLERDLDVIANQCQGEITLCHSLKTSARLVLNGPEREAADNECCGGCEGHHYFTLDLLAPETTASIVREAIRRRVFGDPILYEKRKHDNRQS